MRKIKEVLRLKWSAGLGSRAIARSVKIGKTTVDELVRRATEAGLSWPLPPEIDEAALEQLLYPPSVTPEDPSRPLPDLQVMHQELSRKGVSLSLLWNEYKERHPQGYSTASSANSTGSMPGSSISPCARSTGQEKSCSSITAGKPNRSSIVEPEKCGRPRSS